MKTKINNNKTSERFFGLDLLRTLAVLLVLSVHFFLNTSYYSTDIVGTKMHLQMYIRNFCMSCVPLFLMLSAFLGNKKKYDKKFLNRLNDILIIWVFYSIIEYFVLLFVNHNSFSFLDFIYKFTNFSACSYSWYIEMFIGLYLISPLLNSAFDSLDDSSKDWSVIAVFIVFNLPAFVNLLSSKYFHFPSFWISYYYLSYYFYGKYISYKRPKINKVYLVIALLITEFLSAIYANYFSVWYDSITIVFQSLLLFLILYDLNIKNVKIKKLFELISVLSLDIYLASSLTDKFVYPKLLNIVNVDGQSYLLYYMPLFVLTTFVLSFLYSLIRKKIIKV